LFIPSPLDAPSAIYEKPGHESVSEKKPDVIGFFVFSEITSEVKNASSKNQ
jgi:hypothetical protein